MSDAAGGAGGAALHAHVVVHRDDFRLDVEVEIAAGEVVGLLGPNGAGKSTTLRALAGLLPLTDGRVELDGAVLEDVAERRRVPTERRSVGVVFQDYLLFPHLSALENIAFGPRARGVPRKAARTAAAQWLDRVGLADRAAARPRHLSGGQAQRVALARALANEPRLLLLDEPLAALDATTRLDIRARLRHHLDAFDGAALLVTHDPLDAMVLADRLVIIEHGAVVQRGRPADVARRPRTRYVARLVGLNLYRGAASGHEVRLDGGVTLTVADACEGDVFVAFPPSAVALHRTRPDGSPRNAWPVRVEGLEWHGDQARVRLVGTLDAVADLTPGAVADLAPTPGAELWAAVKALQTHAYPA